MTRPSRPAPRPRPASSRRRTPPHDYAPRSRRLCITAARFGLRLPEAPAPGQPRRDPHDREWLAGIGCAALAVDALLGLGQTCLITGPSGAGKTTLLRRIAHGTPARIIDIDAPRLRTLARSGTAPIDLFSLPLDTTLRLLAAAGLAEAPLLVRAAAHLSEGQRFRLRLALAMAAALRLAARGANVTLIADEFCAALDGPTSASVCLALSRWVRATGVRLIVAAPGDDLRPFLRPHLIAATSLSQAPEVRHAMPPRFLDDAATRPGAAPLALDARSAMDRARSARPARPAG